MYVEYVEINEDNIMHHTRVDFNSRMNTDVIFLVQYDRSLPIVEVSLYYSGNIYTIPENASIKVRWGKPDRTFIYKDVLGCDITRTKVYFDIDEQMTYFSGESNPILELQIGSMFAGSSYMPVNIERNPIQNGDYESAIVYPDLEKALKGAVTNIVSDSFDVTKTTGTVKIELKTKDKELLNSHIITNEETDKLINDILGG